MKSDTECVCIYIHTHHSIYRFLYTYTTFGFPSVEAFNLLKFKSHRQKKHNTENNTQIIAVSV